MDILPSTRKRISSGCAGNGGTAPTFFGDFDRDFRSGDFALFVTRGFCGERPVAGLRDLNLRLRGGILAFADSFASPLGQRERTKVRGLKRSRVNYSRQALTLALS